MTTSEPDPPLVRMEGITKRFGGTEALRDVDFEARAGEVHALCGENGAGKSTLMKVLAGAIGPDEGRILVEGRAVRWSGPRSAEDHGIRIIHQELNLVPDLTVADNIFLGRERTAFGVWLDERAMARHAAEVFARLGTPIPPRAPVGGLRIGDQQMVEIAKTLAFRASVVIMDEPTSALSDAEVARLFRVIGELRQGGVAVIYISHKMNEVFTLADRVTVLRDGRLVASALRAETTPDQVVRWMVGREIAAFAAQPHPAPTSTAPALRVRNLTLPRPSGTSRPALRDITFDLRGGEVLGVAGLLGAGRTELLEALFGAAGEPAGGLIELDGRPARFSRPAQAIARGIALVTEDRKTLGLFDQMSVSENITIAGLDRLSRGGWVAEGDERQAVADLIRRLRIKAPSPEASIMSLSGGNQQKCLLGRWLLRQPRLLLLDEPTRGIDVGAKAEIYATLRALASEGMAILMTSSELPELLAVCDRILVLCEGRLTADLPRSEASEETIMHAATRFLDRTPVGAAER